jgi:hypothetical protein
MEDRIADAIAIGHRNKEIIDLAFAWCQNIKLDRSQMGIGLVEQQTGLPISGGTFICDFAKGHSPCGMQLERIAFDFYQRNCSGCSHRKPKAVLNNLGTWAEGRLNEQNKRAEQAKKDDELREQERQERHRNRRLTVGEPDALIQSILDLIERIDRKESDPDAAKELIALAQLHPVAFSNELLQVLLIDAKTHRLSPLLEAVIIVHEADARPTLEEVLPVAYSAIAHSWGNESALRLIEEHVQIQDLDRVRGLFQAIVSLAGPHTAFHRGPAPLPGILLRLYSLNPERTCELLSVELKHGNDWRRGSAAQASGSIFAHDSTSASYLLDALLDALKLPDQSSLGPEEPSSSQVAQVISELYRYDPQLVEAAIDRRWKRASEEYRCSLFDCYDKVIRGRLGEKLSSEAATLVARRALNCSFDSSNEELARAAGDLLGLVFEYNGEAVQILPDTLLGALVVLCEQKEKLSESAKPRDYLEAMDLMSVGLRIDGSIHHVMDALVSSVTFSSSLFWPALSQVWDHSADESSLRRSLVTVVGRCAKSYHELPSALPYLYTALMGVDFSCRARAVEALGEVRWNDRSEIPEAVSLGILLALEDEYLAVVSAATRAIRNVHIPPDKRATIIVHLLHIASVYASDRKWSNMVVDALQSVLELTDDSINRDKVSSVVLLTICKMPQYEAVKALLRYPFRVLKESRQYISTVVFLIRHEEDRNYRELGSNDRESLLREISRFSSEQIEPHVSALIDNARCSLEVAGNHWWAWMIADVLSEHEFFEAALDVCDQVVASIQDTLEKRPLRLYARQVAESQRFEVAVACSDTELRNQAAEAWRGFIELARKDEEENRDAREPFFPRIAKD